MEIRDNTGDNAQKTATGNAGSRRTNGDLQQSIAQSNKTRKKAKIIMLIGAVIAIGSIVGNIENNLFIVIGGIAIVLVGYNMLHKATTSIKSQLSQNLIPDVLSEFFDDVEYDPEGVVPMNEVEDAFWGGFNRSSGSDYVKGRYKGVNVQMCDLCLQKVESVSEIGDDSGKTREEVTTLLSGQWIILDFPKKLSSNVSVLTGIKSVGDIETENEEFNKKFSVSAADPHDAFYLLTPHMIDHILTLYSNTGGNIDLMFMKEGKLHIAVDSHRNHFEARSTKETDLNALRDKYRKEIDYVIALVEEIRDELQK